VYEAVMKENIVIRQVPENDINCLRVSTHIYNNKQEIDSLMDVLKKFA
jgi:L-cysteine/cystine lyase